MIEVIRNRRAMRHLAILAGVSLTAMAAPALAQEAAAEAAQDAAPDQPAAEEIIIRGIRGSLQRAADRKRNADQIKDVIDAEDIGKLPDTNVAEAMQRVTGVQINRDLGEGSEIAVRGFSQNRIEINGQTQLGSEAGGGVAFNTIPSEALSNIEVIKTPSASDVEGALGATVRFNTRMPLDNGGKLILSAGAQAQYAERADKWTPNVSLLASKGWSVGDGGQIGVLLSYTRNHRRLRQDFFDVRGWEAVNSTVNGGTALDLDGDGVRGETIVRDRNTGIITDLQDGVYVPLQTRLRIIDQDRRLESYTAAIQIKPSDRFEFYVNGTYNRNRTQDYQYQVVANLTNAIEPDPANPGSSRLARVYSNVPGMTISENQTVTSAFVGRTQGTTPTGIGYNIAGSSNPPEQDVYNIQTGVKWSATNRLKVEAQLAVGFGRQFNKFINTTSGIAGVDRPFFFFDYNQGTDIPTLMPLQSSVAGRPVTGPSPDAAYNFTNLAIYSFNNVAVNRDTQKTTETAYRLDFDWEVDAGPIRAFEFGGRIANSRGYRFRMRGRDGPGSADGTLGSRPFTQIDALEPGFVTALPFGDLLDGATGDFQRFWYVVDPRYMTANIDRLFTKYGISYALDESWRFDVRRTDYAAYAKANLKFDLAGMPVFGNIGVRWIRTDQSAMGVIPGGRQGAVTLDRVTVDKDYSKFLPSLNLVFQPADKFYVRFGAAKAIARPSLADVAPTIVVSDSFDRANGGNPLLNPQEVNQVDLSIEKYYGKGNLISAAFFYKNFVERIEKGVVERCMPTPDSGLETTPGNDGCLVGQDITRVETPVNVGGATVKGVELSWQQALDFLPSPLDGFGFVANYTYVDADGGSISAGGTRLPVQDLSKHSYNLIGYFEKWGFKARAAYNWRSEFYDERTDTNQASFAKPYGQLDASIGFDITKNISISAEALNILNEPERRYQEIEERLLSYRVNDRRFLFGVRIRN